jgi:hypothetical protein
MELGPSIDAMPCIATALTIQPASAIAVSAAGRRRVRGGKSVDDKAATGQSETDAEPVVPAPAPDVMVPLGRSRATFPSTRARRRGLIG